MINPDPAVAPKNRLFLFLGGSNSKPSAYTEIQNVGVSRGYHAINLAYPDDSSVGKACKGDRDPDCTAKVRREVLTGEDAIQNVNVNVPNSVIGRLTDLLKHLQKFLMEQWGQFLTKDQQVDWSLVTAGGHSQGAGHVAVLAKLFELDRTAMFSGVADLTFAKTTAPWLRWPNKTPPSRQYGFGHLYDGVVPFLVQLAS